MLWYESEGGRYQLIIIIIVEVIIDDGENGIIDLIIVDKWFLEEMNIVILFILDIMKIMLEKISTGKDAFGNPIYGWFYFCFFRLIFI